MRRVAQCEGFTRRSLQAENSTPNPQKGGYPAPSRVTFLTGANRDFPKWRRQRAAHAAIVESLIGDEDEATNEVCGPEFKALHAFAETVPTTLPGLLAMIVYAGECSANNAEAFADSDCPLIETLAAAAKAIAQVQS